MHSECDGTGWAGTGTPGRCPQSFMGSSTRPANMPGSAHACRDTEDRRQQVVHECPGMPLARQTLQRGSKSTPSGCRGRLVPARVVDTAGASDRLDRTTDRSADSELLGSRPRRGSSAEPDLQFHSIDRIGRRSDPCSRPELRGRSLPAPFTRAWFRWRRLRDSRSLRPVRRRTAWEWAGWPLHAPRHPTDSTRAAPLTRSLPALSSTGESLIPASAHFRVL
jgi:hypothetical protein